MNSENQSLRPAIPPDTSPKVKNSTSHYTIKI